MSSKRVEEPSSAFVEQLKSKSRARREALSEVGEADARRRSPRNDLTPQLDLRPWRIADLRLPRRNVRRASMAHAREITASIAELGYCDPVLVDQSGEILDGAERVEACKLLGLETIQCIEIGHLTAKGKRLLRVAANRLQEKGGWDLDALRIEFDELILADAAIEITGFDAAEIDIVLLDDAPAALEQGPLAPDPKAERIARPGDLFALGRHLVLCGDAREPELWRRLMNVEGEREELAALIKTDVPYNVPVVGNVTGDQSHREFAMASGEMTDDEFFAFNLAWMRAASPYLREGGLFGTFIDWRGLDVVTAAAKRLEFVQLNLVVWGKTNAGMGSLYRSRHELLPLFKKGVAPHVNNIELGRKGRWRSNLWSYPGASSPGSDARKGLKDHPTVKPLAMLEDALLDLTNRGDLVLDPFLGSGSTLIAAEKTGRICRGIEIDPLYVDVVIRRWQGVTGQRAMRIGCDEDERRRSEQSASVAPTANPSQAEFEPQSTEDGPSPR